MGLFRSPTGCRKGGEGPSFEPFTRGLGHVVARLLKELPIAVPEELIDKAKVLDAFYIPTRYANGHPEGAPFEHYGPLQSADGIKYASEIIEFAGAKMAAS
jgi:HEPN domain-containing protein